MQVDNEERRACLPRLSKIAIVDFGNVLCSFHTKYERFGPLYVANHVRTKARRSGHEIGIDESKICPLQTVYDAKIHDAVGRWPICVALMEPFPFIPSTGLL